MDNFYKYRYFHNFNYDPLEITYTYKYKKINKNTNIMEDFEMTFTYPGHITPLLGIHYYLNLPDNHPLKLKYEDIIFENEISDEEKHKLINNYVENLEKYTLDDINEFFNLFNENRLINNIKKLILNLNKYYFLFCSLGFNYHCQIYIYDYIEFENYLDFKSLFLQLEKKEENRDVFSRIPEYIKYLFGIPYLLKPKNKTDRIFIYDELYHIINRSDIYDYILSEIKLDFDFYNYIFYHRSHSLMINLKFTNYLNKNLHKYNLNKYTYENPNSGLEDPIFIKYVDDFIKNYKKAKRKNKNIIFNLEFANYLTYKEYKYLKDNGIKFDFDDSNF